MGRVKFFLLKNKLDSLFTLYQSLNDERLCSILLKEILKITNILQKYTIFLDNYLQ